MNTAPRLLVAALSVIALSSSAHATINPLYSFENNLDGFFATGASSVAPSTIGVTDGSTSLEYSLITPATFEGARTETVIPAGLADPPGITEVLFDLTIVEQFTGGFASLGITTFGTDGVNFNQFQFSDFIALEALAPGTYTDVSISLEETFGGGPSFNEIYGPGLGEFSATGFQFFLNKSGTAPITIYIDNVRAVVPEPTSFAMVAAALAFGIRGRRAS